MHMFCRRHLSLSPSTALVTAAILAGIVANDRAAEARSPSCFAAEHLMLKNGVEVVLRPDHSLPVVAVVSSMHVGYRNDPPDHAGLAHYVEHLTYRAAPPYPSVFELYRRAGATAYNGSTAADSTDYYALVPAAQLELELWIEARRLGLGLDALGDQAAEDERRGVEREELQRRGEKDSPSRRTMRAVADALYPDGHPYRSSDAAGNLDAMTLDSARWFFARYYRPERVRLVVVGDFQPDAAKRLIEADFGSLSARPLPSDGLALPAPTADPGGMECSWADVRRDKPTRSRVVMATRVRAQSIEFVWPLTLDAQLDRVGAALNYFAKQLSDAARDAGVAESVSAHVERLELGANAIISIGITAGADLDRAEPLVRAVWKQLAEAKPDAQEIAALRQGYELSSLFEERSFLGVAQELAHRECRASGCSDVKEDASAAALGELTRFDPGRALIVERRFRESSVRGDVEVQP